MGHIVQNFPTAKLGPKMEALTPKERALVHNFMRNGGKDYVAAVEAAGLGIDKNRPMGGQSAHAWQFLHSDRIQAALLEESQRLTRGFLPMVLRVLSEIVENPQAQDKDRIRAGLALMERSGLHSVSEQITTVVPLQDDPEKLKAIEVLAQKLNLPVEKLLGERMKRISGRKRKGDDDEPVTLDAEYIDVTPEMAPAPTGLEDLV